MIGLLIIVCAAWCIGGLGVLTLGLRPIEALVLRMYIGIAACAVLILIAGSYSLDLVTYVLAAGAITSWMASRALKPEAVPAFEPSDDDDRIGLLEWACLGAAGFVCTLMLLSALAPVTSWDAGVAHLALPSDYVRDGQIHLLEGNVYSAYPQALHCLFTYLFYTSGERGVALFCWALSVLTCATLYLLAKRLGNRRAGILAVAFLTTAPIFTTQAGTVAIDLPLVGVVLAVLWCLSIWQQHREWKWLVIAGVLAGYGCGIRHTGYLVAALCTLGVLLEGKHPKWAAVFLAVAAVSASPWFVRSYAVIGNPIFPLFDAAFPQELFARHQATEIGRHESIQETSFLGFITFSWDMVMHPDRYDGWSANPGGWVWILGIPGLIMGGRVARMIGIFSLAGISSFYLVQRMVRYAIPFFVPMMAVAGVAGSRLTARTKALSWLIVATLVYGCLLAAGGVYFKLPVVFGMESRETYLERRVERYAAFQWVNDHVPDDGIVLTLDLRSYYIDRPTFQNTESLRALKTMDFDEKVEWFSQRGIRYLMIPEEVIPMTQGMGLDEEVKSWANAPVHFEVFATLDIPRARGEGTERVTIYKVIDPNPGT